MTPERARRAISLVDLTDLTDDCDTAAVARLCQRARRFGTAAVCVWPDFVARAVRALDGTEVGIATVVNFPTGDERAFSVAGQTERALADGATEIDVVLPYRAFLADDLDRAGDVLRAVREATAGRALLKVILETGQLPGDDVVARAARFAIGHGADFVKTSTGKSPVSATVDAAAAMLRVIAESDRVVGIKPSGGISTADAADDYLRLAEELMGEGWISPRTFRFGASSLLGALLREAGLSDDVVAGPTSY